MTVALPLLQAVEKIAASKTRVATRLRMGVTIVGTHAKRWLSRKNYRSRSSVKKLGVRALKTPAR